MIRTDSFFMLFRGDSNILISYDDDFFKLRLAKYQISMRITCVLQTHTRMATGDPIISQTTRARSMPYRATYYIAVIWTILFYVSMLSVPALLVAYLMKQNKLTLNLLIGFIVLTALSGIISIVKCRSAKCPLCRGTPLSPTGALAHKNSSQWGPFTHKQTAILSILFTQRFNCMYCGTKYDLLKAPSGRNHSSPSDFNNI